MNLDCDHAQRVLEAAQAAAQPGDTITEVNATSGEKKYTVTLDYADGDTKDSVYTVTEGDRAHPAQLPAAPATPLRAGMTAAAG